MSAEKGGALRTQTTGGRRALLALLFSATLVVAPLVLLHGSASAAHGAAQAAGRARPASGRVGSAGAGSALAGYRVGSSSNHAPATAAAGPAPTTTTAPPATTTTAPPVTTTTAPPTTTTTAPPAPADESSEEGVATWYSEAPPGGCASPTLAFGTEVEVTDSSDGATASCVVDDREAPNPGRVLDMSYSGFSQLADPSQGVATVTVSW